MKAVRFLITAITAIAVLYEYSYAIPAFARKYDMSCTVCHAPAAPKLKPYGEDFAANGFQLPDKEPPRYFRDTGDDRLLLLREIPLAFRFEMRGEYDTQAKQADLGTPFLLKLLSGGQIAKDVSYYFYFFLSEQGSMGIEDAFVMFNNVGGIDVDIVVGQFQVSDPLFKRELRLPIEDYQIYGTHVGSSRVNLKYDRGMMISAGMPTSTDVVLTIVNGNGIDPTAGAFFDSDKYKNWMLRLSQEIAPQLRIGAFGYAGNELQNAVRNDVMMAGPDATITVEPFELNLQYVYRNDTNPVFTAIAKRYVTQGGFGELIFAPEGDKSEWFATGLYNSVWSDLPGLRYQSAAVAGHYMLARNVRLTAEMMYDLEAKFTRLTGAVFLVF